jgi:hypothetical protein
MIDIQAQDRAHRIGQTKPVVVYRFIVRNTIDERVYKRACSKQIMEKLIVHDGLFYIFIFFFCFNKNFIFLELKQGFDAYDTVSLFNKISIEYYCLSLSRFCHLILKVNKQNPLI